MNSTPEEHKKQAPASAAAAIITVSDTRTPETDKSGKVIKELLLDAGHAAGEPVIIPDDRDAITKHIASLMKESSLDVILITGGTGVAERDVTIETVTPLFEKELPGFGEIFRMLSFTEDIGSSAILSRAAAGTSGKTAIFAMPGSSGAVKLAMTKLILPELRHIKQQLNK
ncbi:molybdenum cofactor biosynthesis protein B [Fictibacillus aquaticus]|uniref:Molybdenum cofactor biosynthesis protein B n=1 Tax=Fictibacillus aquaticus TaxID=2021314 RepID=A0A235FAH7_9BACL|nr:molybdenum cofactor biosynthesis protein B [Fictibacillus aquaticus]OYD58199.1 molybdenum cofactor biosynthesis protein [Fictibacillus aquaticus]